jgi:gluconolactonase
VGTDGVYFTQLGRGFGGWEPEDQGPASIGFTSWAGEHYIIATAVGGRPLNAPNDLAFDTGGWLWFTDPGEFQPDDPDEGWLHALGPHGQSRSLAVGPTFPNGVVGLADGTIAWVESYTRRLMRLTPEGQPVELATLPPGHTPDGLAVAADGAFWIATIGSGGLDRVGPDGALDFLLTGTAPLNCAFLGQHLVVTCDPDPGDTAPGEHGRLLLVDLGVGGATVFRGHVRRNQPVWA